MSSRLTVLRQGSRRWEVEGGETVTTVDCLQQSLNGFGLVRGLFRYDEGRILTHRVESIGRPLKLGLLLRALSRGPCYVEDERGRRRPLTARVLARWTWQSLREPLQKAQLLRDVASSVERLERAGVGRTRTLTLDAAPVYLRTDVSFGVKAGGSVAHTAGVLNHLGEFAGQPVVLTTDSIPTLHPDIETHLVSPAEAFWGYRELPSFVMNRQFAQASHALLADRRLAFVYQRYAVNNFAGARLAVERRLPLVLEYNGSEIWMSRHWGTPLEHEALSARIEAANLTTADLVVVVSQAMADELTSRGFDRAKILVNPNGVEPDVYSPDVDGTPVRRQYGLEGKIVIGFIGTFGPWHGAEILAAAFGRLLERRPADRASVRLLMIGDGRRMPDVVRALDTSRVRDLAVLTGVVSQRDGPAHLAACDILVSPHVPNADGSPFFGSPTKVFEYMAMGKAIVASDLDQVGDVLEHGRAARMVVPGDVDSLVAGLAALVDSPEEDRRRLGAHARRLAVERHSWREHVRRIVARLQELAPIS